MQICTIRAGSGVSDRRVLRTLKFTHPFFIISVSTALPSVLDNKGSVILSFQMFWVFIKTISCLFMATIPKQPCSTLVVSVFVIREHLGAKLISNLENDVSYYK